MHRIDDPSSLTPQERLSEIAGVLANGILRLHARPALSSSAPGLDGTSSSNSAGLERSEEANLGGHTDGQSLTSQKNGKCSSLDVEQVAVAFRRMTQNELRTKYAEVFGEQTTSRNKESLVRQIIWRLHALAEGDIPERARRQAAKLTNRSVSPSLEGQGDSPAG